MRKGIIGLIGIVLVLAVFGLVALRIPSIQDRAVMAVLEGYPFRESFVEIGAGDILVAFTDGLTETRRPDGELFGEKRLRTLLADKKDRDACSWHRDVIRAVARFRDGGEAHDDLTVVIAEFPGAR